MAEIAGVHLREARAHAREIKFVVDAARGPDVQAWMRANLAPAFPKPGVEFRKRLEPELSITSE